jgi:hypothetical protein
MILKYFLNFHFHTIKKMKVKYTKNDHLKIDTIRIKFNKFFYILNFLLAKYLSIF